MKPGFFEAVLLASAWLARASAAPEPAALLEPREITAVVASREVRLVLVVFSADTHRLQVLDNGGSGNAPRVDRIADALPDVGAVAGCNGGFFDRDPFLPVGFMISGGTRTGSISSKPWMGGLLVVRGGMLRFESTAGFEDTADVTDLLQSGPWLVRAEVPEANGDTRRARRTFVCRDAGDRWAIGTADPCTLAELSAALASESVGSLVRVDEALNLDGGPSSALWVRGRATNYSVAERWPVRNYLAVVPRLRGHRPNFRQNRRANRTIQEH